MPRELALLQPVLDIWGEVLAHRRGALSADSNLFLSGGDSLDLLRIIVRMRERLGVELDFRDAAQLSTPRKMAMRGSGKAAVRALPVAAPREKRAWAATERFPCTTGQSALWLAEMASGGSGLYNAAVALQFEGALDVAALTRALQAVLFKHAILRARFRFDAVAQQLFVDIARVQSVVLQAKVMPLEVARRHFQELATRPFDLGNGPLWRFELAHAGHSQWWLLLCVHHIVTDAWSGSVMLRNLAASYNAARGDPSWRETAVEREFQHFCLHRYGMVETHWPWWRNYLRGADRLRSWPPTGALQWPFAMACEERALDAHVLNRVEEATRANNVLPSAFYLCALRLALRAFTGLDELCIGLPVNVRDSSAQEDGVGYFVNLLVTRDRIADLAPHAALQVVQHSLSELLLHRVVAFSDLARELQPALLPSGNPWCDILFAFRNLPATCPDFGGLQVSVHPLPPALGQHPLKVEFVITDGNCICRIEYAHELLTAPQVNVLLAEIDYQVAALARLSCRSS